MKPRTVHLLRTLMFASILLSIHWQHRKFVAAQATLKNWSDAMPMIREILSAAHSVRDRSESQFAEVLDADETVLAEVTRTSPSADHILGFSGPTDVLLTFDGNGKLAAAHVLSSRDTRDHVRKVLEDSKFLRSLNGRTPSELMDLSDVDAVSGATLTSCAILEAIRFQILTMDGAGQETMRLKSLKFPNPPRLEDVRLLYPNAKTLEQNSASDILWHVLDSSGSRIGDLLRASPVADNNVGFQGPTDVLISVDALGHVSGIAPGVSYDNEPYVDYVREDEYFRNSFNGRDIKTLAALDSSMVEGVSGATMTSQTVARSLQMTAQAFVDDQRRKGPSHRPDSWANSLKGPWAVSTIFTLRNFSTIGITLVGVILGLTHLRSRRWLRVTYQCLVIVWLGLINGDMVSQALLLGWAQSGIAWQNALGLNVLTAAALLVPISTGRNVYCSHICPHGAIQQLVRRRLPWQTRIPPRIHYWLKYTPIVLIAWVVTIGLLHLPFSPVDIEPFDAWLWMIAGIATIMVAMGGLIASMFVPMAYCRFGCPTGALLDYLSSSSGKSWSRRDAIVLLIIVACGIINVIT